ECWLGRPDRSHCTSVQVDECRGGWSVNRTSAASHADTWLAVWPRGNAEGASASPSPTVRPSWPGSTLPTERRLRNHPVRTAPSTEVTTTRTRMLFSIGSAINRSPAALTAWNSHERGCERGRDLRQGQRRHQPPIRWAEAPSSPDDFGGQPFGHDEARHDRQH